METEAFSDIKAWNSSLVRSFHLFVLSLLSSGRQAVDPAASHSDKASLKASSRRTALAFINLRLILSKRLALAACSTLLRWKHRNSRRYYKTADCQIPWLPQNQPHPIRPTFGVDFHSTRAARHFPCMLINMGLGPRFFLRFLKAIDSSRQVR